MCFDENFLQKFQNLSNFRKHYLSKKCTISKAFLKMVNDKIQGNLSWIEESKQMTGHKCCF